MIADWLLSQLHWQRPGLWLLVSMASSLLLLIGGRWLSPHQRYRLRWLRWLLVPYGGLLVGGLSPRLMGLSDIDWVAGLGLGVVLIFIVWVLLVLIRTTLHLDGTDASEPSRPVQSILNCVLIAGAQEFHWTFLRAATWEMLLYYPAPLPTAGYRAVWIASLLALPGILVQYRRPSQHLIATVVLVTTTILFFYTRNFWLCWLLHASAQLLLGQDPAYQPSLGEAERPAK